ncbi:MAG: DMT family transporter [Planctomycetaceae bacterium]
MKTALLMLVAALAACVIPVQSVVNGRLGVLTDNRLLAAFISFVGGTLILGLLMVTTSKGIPSLPAGTSIPWYLCTGGLLGAVFVTAVLSLVPQIGTAKVLAAAIVGQLIMSLIVDHFGLLNVPKDPVTLKKIFGCLLLVLGTVLIQFGKQ